MSIQIDPRRINVIAKLAFAPIYPYLAQQIKDKFGFTDGICVDIGSGPGSLAIATARITNLTLFSLDIQPEMASIARDNIAEAGLSSRIHIITADVCRLPFEDSSVDLVISRGSIFFWEDRVAAFREIYRILKRGGAAYCGGGMGNEEIKTQVMAAFSTNEVLKAEKEAWQEMVGHISQKLNPEGLQAELARAQVPGTVVRENGGLWVQIIKKLRQD
jgi:ubiquinone/menaquinone biosynthesis C-methylase UbiE